MGFKVVLRTIVFNEREYKFFLRAKKDMIIKEDSFSEFVKNSYFEGLTRARIKRIDEALRK